MSNSKYQQTSQSLARSLSLFLGFMLLICADFVFASSTESIKVATAGDIIKNIAAQIPQLMRMLTALSYVVGFYFVILGIMHLKKYGEQRTMMSSEHSMKATIVMLVIGSLLIYLPSAVNVGLSTFWTSATPYEYLNQTGSVWTSATIKTCFMIVQLLGVISFIRGLVMLSQLAGQGGHHGVLAKGMTHIIGGILCINIYQFVEVILNTIGVTISGFNS